MTRFLLGTRAQKKQEDGVRLTGRFSHLLFESCIVNENGKQLEDGGNSLLQYSFC